MSDEWADSKIDVDGVKGCLRSFQQLKVRHGHLKVILSVGGGGKGSDNFASVAANPATRERFASSAKELVLEYGLDGIDSLFSYKILPKVTNMIKQSIGNIRPTTIKVETTFISSQPYANPSLLRSTS